MCLLQCLCFNPNVNPSLMTNKFNFPLGLGTGDRTGSGLASEGRLCSVKKEKGEEATKTDGVNLDQRRTVRLRLK